MLQASGAIKTTWNEKKQAYAKMLEHLTAESEAINRLPHIIKRHHLEEDAHKKAALREEVMAATRKLVEIRERLLGIYTAFGIFADDRCTYLILDYLRQSPPLDPFAEGWIESIAALHNKLFIELFAIADEDLKLK